MPGPSSTVYSYSPWPASGNVPFALKPVILPFNLRPPLLLPQTSSSRHLNCQQLTFPTLIYLHHRECKVRSSPTPKAFSKGTQTHPAELRFRGKHSEPLSPRQTRAQRHTATCSETKHVSMPDPLHSLTLRTDPQTQSGTYTRSLPCLAIIWNIF